MRLKQDTRPLTKFLLGIQQELSSILQLRKCSFGSLVHLMDAALKFQFCPTSMDRQLWTFVWD